MRILENRHFIANHPKHFNIPWAQNIIDQHIPNILVKEVTVISVDTGTTTRVRLDVSHNGPDTLARKWFVKIPSLSWRAKVITALPRLLHTEIRFYNELSQLIPIHKPTALSAASLPGKGSTLVLNDLTEQNAIIGHPGDTISAKQAYLVIEKIAALHARFWNLSQHKTEFRWLAGPVRKLEDQLGTALAVPLMKLGLKKAGKKVPQNLHAHAIHYARNRKKAMEFLSQGTQTIIHHDCHPGNLFWQQTEPGFLDWQMVRIGDGIGDIAYFLATSLHPDERRSKENALLQHYLDCLIKNGIKPIEFKEIQKRYCAHLSYPFEAMLITLAVGGMMERKANMKLIARTACAVEDNNTFSTLPI